MKKNGKTCLPENRDQGIRLNGSLKKNEIVAVFILFPRRSRARSRKGANGRRGHSRRLRPQSKARSTRRQYRRGAQRQCWLQYRRGARRQCWLQYRRGARRQCWLQYRRGAWRQCWLRSRQYRRGGPPQYRGGAKAGRGAARGGGERHDTQDGPAEIDCACRT